ncbi:MAG: hypothetical protein OEY01_11235 [Desulfobulbaceae bacterium]|nr:hypothetical protein [Desulfobulbaceae bacterium]
MPFKKLDRENRKELMYDEFSKVCESYQMDPEDALQNNRSRAREYVEVRQLSIALFICKLKASTGESGRFFGKDHATAIHATKTIRNLVETDRTFRLQTAPLLAGVNLY